MSMERNLLQANEQWRTRPQDERFHSLQEMYDQTKAYANQSGTKDVSYRDIRVQAQDKEVVIVGKENKPAKLTNWAFGQLAGMCKGTVDGKIVTAPADYLRSLPPTMAAQNLNHGLAARADQNERARLLFHVNGSLLVRAISSDEYVRVWNYEIVERLLDLVPFGWAPATPTFKHTSNDFTALYASDHDMFAFLTNNSRTIKEPGNPTGLKRGFIARNSEVVDGAIKILGFGYRELCDNYLIIGAKNLFEISIRHVGQARIRWTDTLAEIKRYADSSATIEESRIVAAMKVKLGSTKEEVLDTLFGKRSLNLSRRTLEAAYDAVNPDQDGDPNTVWGITQGITRHSQTLPFADKRNTLDVAAGKVMELAF